MSLPYESATSGERALVEAQTILAKFGCQSFGTGQDAERGVTLVQFKHRGRVVNLEASWKGYAAAWLREHPYTASGYGKTRASEEGHKQRALAQAKISVCSVLRDFVKAQVTVIECGIMSFEEAFLPHLLMADGRRVIDKVQSDKLLPPPQEPANVIRLGER